MKYLQRLPVLWVLNMVQIKKVYFYVNGKLNYAISLLSSSSHSFSKTCNGGPIIKQRHLENMVVVSMFFSWPVNTLEHHMISISVSYHSSSGYRRREAGLQGDPLARLKPSNFAILNMSTDTFPKMAPYMSSISPNKTFLPIYYNEWS